MKRIYSIFVLLCLSLMSFAIDWSNYAWLGSGEEAYANKFKVAAAFGQTVVNIQKPEWAPEWGIYTNVPAGIESVSGLPDGKFKIEGAGALLFVSAFTQKETKVTIAAGGVDYECTVYYADGAGEEGGGGEEEGGGEGGDPQPGDLTPATFVGQATAEILGNQVAFNWSITRNADKTLTFEISWDKDIEGCVPQICIADQFSTMPFEGHKAVFTTKDKYNDGDAFSGFFYIAYVGNATRIDIVGYIIGKSNTGGDEGGEGGEEGGSEESGDEAFESIESSNLQILKFVEDGTLYILRDGKIYTVNGQIIK